MRLAVAAACAVPAILSFASGTRAQEVGGFGQPSCIASTLPAARAQTRLIPAEIKGPVLGQVRGMVVRSLTWKGGQSIKVCFLTGTRKAQERVIRIAREWMQYANVVFDFEEGGAPRACKGDNSEDIKVTFEDNKGWWSVPGMASRNQNPSMNLQFFGVDTPMLKNGQPAPEGPIRATILHEFGHALGLMHEHQSPNANCDAEIDWDAAYKVGAGMGWDQAQVDRNFRQLANTTSLNATEVDRKSIMHYSLPPTLFKRGKESACYVTENLELSEQDRKFIASVYPKAEVPMVVSNAPPTTVTRGAAKRPAGEDRQALVRRYEELLKQSGIEAGKVRDLVAEFRKSAESK
jgi:astacin (peptidase family M12A)